jgi:hypothetical protein
MVVRANCRNPKSIVGIIPTRSDLKDRVTVKRPPNAIIANTDACTRLATVVSLCETDANCATVSFPVIVSKHGLWGGGVSRD